MKNKIFKISAVTVACLMTFAVGGYCLNNKANMVNGEADSINEEPIIFTEVSHFDTLYDFSDNKVLAEHSDLVVIGKLKNLGIASNYNSVKQSYGKACTPGTIEVTQILKNSTNQTFNSIEFWNIGGTIKYSDYEKSLLPAQKAKREYLMQQSGINPQTRKNIYVNQTVEDQLEIVEGKTYIFYLYYNEDYERYMVVTQPYGIKEYNQETGKILNHITNGIENLDEMV